jgi:conjugal transfer/entry exclusion protein
MIYTEQIQNQLESLDGKLRILQNGITGAQQLSPSEAYKTLEDMRKIVERIAELNRINR